MSLEWRWEGTEDDDDDEEEPPATDDLAPEEKRARVWPDVATELAQRYQREVQQIRNNFEEEVDMFDTTMVSEYADEIFQYMEEMEVSCAPIASSVLVLNAFLGGRYAQS